MEYDFEKTVEECEDLECKDHIVILYEGSQIKEQLVAVEEEVENAEVMIATLNGLPRSWDSFMQGMCAKRN